MIKPGYPCYSYTRKLPSVTWRAKRGVAIDHRQRLLAVLYPSAGSLIG